MRRKGVLKEKQELLEKYRRVLDTRILIRLDARALKETQDMQCLDRGVQDLVFAIEKGQNTVEELMVIQSRQIKDHIDSAFKSRTRGSEDAIARQRLLEGLFYPEIVSREEQIPEAFQGTCGWIFDSAADERSKYRTWANFRSWLETENGVYWISGKPGSGKSTLMKYIVNEDSTTRLLSDWERGTDLVVISFFFWNAGTALQKSCTGLLRSLLYQVATQWPGLAYLVSAQHGKSTREVEVSNKFHLLAAWTDQRLLSLLSLFLDQKPDSLSVCAFVDGLDEFVGDEDLLLDMIRLFRETSKCKICVSSRPEQAFRQEFRRCLQLRVQDLNREDIKRMATGKLLPSLRRHKNLPQDSDDAKWLVDNLIEKASGVFLWLDLMIKDLIRGLRNHDTLEQLKSRLDRTPDTINGVYAHMIQSLDPLYSEESAKYFRVLLVAVDLGFYTTLQRLVCAEGEP
ncbi:MAG: hypothetical protein LQ338_005002, partial [Usnochroma carphineum]